MPKSNIVLIGMPASGKSSLGLSLSRRMGLGFADSDLMIQAREGKKLFEIMQESGADSFLKIENEVNRTIAVSRCVIATGGSAVYGKEAMEHLSGIGVIVYLRISLPALEERLHNMRSRGVVLRKGQTLQDLYRERIPLYEKYADVTIEVERQSSVETVEKIRKRVAAFRRKEAGKRNRKSGDGIL